MASILRQKALLGLYLHVAIIKRPGEGQVDWAPTFMNFELDIVIRKALNETEAKILSTFESILFRPGGVNRQNSLVVWVCLWHLLLHYKWVMPWVAVTWRDHPLSKSPTVNIVTRHFLDIND
jgi:hypothetical protein